MTKTLILLAAVLSISLSVASAQAPAANTAAPATEAPLPPYAYCEIIGNHLPSYKGDGVLIDFGQQTRAWAYNWIRDNEGRKISFNSTIEALNYLTRQGWEFVQAYTSGDKGQSTHMLLRMETARLSEAQRQQLLTKPRAKSSDEK